MRNLAIILGLVLLSLAGFVCWQFGASYLANYELQTEMQDLAVQSAFRIGLAPADTEEELRDRVIAEAKEDGIHLEPQQLTVQRTLTPDMLSISLAADYEVRVNLLLYSRTLHFTPSSSHSGKVIVK
ncbi:MAG: hypothetical protein ACRD5M_16425 [Candidatus Acidiferrales bacterium]